MNTNTHILSDATIGFQKATYMESEGDFGTLTQLEVCVELFLSGEGAQLSLQREVNGTVLSRPVTASSKKYIRLIIITDKYTSFSHFFCKV